MSLILLFNPFDFILELVNLIPKTVYFICASFISVLDLFQLLMRKLAGLDNYYVDGVEQTGDIGLHFIQGIFESNSKFPVLRNTFLALILFGVILLILTTIVAVIRQEYMPGGDDMKERPSNNKMIIVGKSIKSLFLFLIVPVSCFFGIFLGNVFLIALDKITVGSNSNSQLFTVSGVTDVLESQQSSTGQNSYVFYDFFGIKDAGATTNTTFSGAIFKTAGFSANRVRINDSYNISGVKKTYSEWLIEGNLSNFNLFNKGSTNEECAQIIDDAFANCVRLKNPVNLNVSDTPMSSLDSSLLFRITNSDKVTQFSKFNVGLVWYYYDLWQFNYLIAFAFLIVCSKILVNIILGLMSRIVEMIALFLISPPIIAAMPLDGGRTFNEWRKNFIAKVLSAYGAIIGMNLFFLILPYLNMIEFLPNTNGGFMLVNLLLSSLFIITGLVAVKNFIALLSKIVGSDDTNKLGENLGEEVGATINKSATYMGAAVGFGTAPVRLAGKTAMAGVNLMGRKISGNSNWTAGGAIVNSRLARGAGNVGKGILNFGRKALNPLGYRRAQREAQSYWEDGGATEQYDNYLNSDSEFKTKINNAFENRTDKSMDYENWSNTNEYTTARSSIVDEMVNRTDNPLQSYSDFAEAEEGAGKDYFNANIHTRTNSALISALARLSSTSSIFYDTLKQSVVRGGKGGLKSMMYAFAGMSSKEIEQRELYKKYEKEERARQEIQTEMEEQRRRVEALENKTNVNNTPPRSRPNQKK